MKNQNEIEKEKINLYLGIICLLFGIIVNIYAKSWGHYTISAISLFIAGLSLGSLK